MSQFETPHTILTTRLTKSVNWNIEHDDDDEQKLAQNRCAKCGDKCGLIIYKQFASEYVNDEIIDEEAMDLMEGNNSFIIDDENYLYDEEILNAKRKYLRYHHYDNNNIELQCEYNICFPLQKMKSNDIKILNGLNEFEQCHLAFYHKFEFNKFWILSNRGRSIRYSHKPLSNDELNDDNGINIRAAFKLKQLSVEMTADNLRNMQYPNMMSAGSNSSTSSISTPYSPYSHHLAPISPIREAAQLKYTKSVRYQKLLVDKHKKKQPPTDVILFGYEFTENEGKYKNPKQEVLDNDLLKTSIKTQEWNNLLRSCSSYVKMKNAKIMQLKMKEVVALKLYTDFDELQREFRRCFRIEDDEQRGKVQKHFVHWNNLLVIACKKAKDDISDKLYHGVSLLSKACTFNGKYWGPVSTTTVLDVAKQFSGDNGTILQLYSSYQKSGVRLSWLSNYPDEDEVLYMNVTFEIIDIIDPNTEHSKLVPIQALNNLSKQIPDFDTEKIKNSLQKISKNSNVLSFNINGNGFSELQDNDKISILKLLYLQYKEKRWQQICNKNGDCAKILTSLRDQFVQLVEKVKAVEMHNTSPLIQDFFSSDQKYYKFPLSEKVENVKKDLEAFNNKFKNKKEHYFRFQTIIRLFPEVEQISINAINWDFTLNSFVKFLEKWQYDYTAVPLKYIDIKFCENNNNCNDDERAIQELERNKASSNISKLLKLGWKFLTPSTLSRVPFEPAPELPFLLTFLKKHNKENDKIDNVVFYRRYTQEVLQRTLSHKSVEGYDDDNDNNNNNNNNIWSEMEGSDNNIKQDDDIKQDNSGNVTEIYHNPKICVLNKKVWDKIQYKNDLKKMLSKIRFGKLLSPKGPGAKDEESLIIDSFQKACNDVRILILDPLPNDLKRVFCQKDDNNKDVISYQWIYDIFPKVCDIFLRKTQFDLNECERLCTFLSKMESQNLLPFERIFYAEKKEEEKDPMAQLKKSPSMFVFLEDEEYDDTPNEMQQMVKMLKDSADWMFQDNGQIVFCNNIYKHHDTNL